MNQQFFKNQPVFAFFLDTGKLARQTVMLAESLRTFGGKYQSAPLWAFIPNRQLPLAEPLDDKLSLLDVSIHTFDIDPRLEDFPFSWKVFASSKAEFLAIHNQSLLIWMDTGSLFIQDPDAVILPDNKIFGYRPVDHILIGSPYYRPLDVFWNLIYKYCRVPEKNVFLMTTSQDGQYIRPYFNAGLLVVRPQFTLLQTWARNFISLSNRPDFQFFFVKKHLHWIFFHQAVLTGTILAKLEPDQMLELPRFVNYPLHMHEKYPERLRPKHLHELITLRYEKFFEEADWEAIFCEEEPLLKWLKLHLGQR